MKKLLFLLLLPLAAFAQNTKVVPDWQGVLRWAGNKPQLRDEVKRYFLNRNEDDTTVGASERPLI